MGKCMYFLKFVDAHLSLDLCGIQFHMTKHGLDKPDARTALQH